MATANRLVDVDPLTISNGFVRGLGFGANGDWAHSRFTTTCCGASRDYGS